MCQVRPTDVYIGPITNGVQFSAKIEELAEIVQPESAAPNKEAEKLCSTQPARASHLNRLRMPTA
jgi:hypothetical protein